ncbi:hypothetical protein AVEN_89890-1 [Araneus ventricosus]|uniref:Uncharacterized protein n=1 Tax=Araneus ventricosus TaxID=182803 RepID=A0A4Y2NHA0_ARAVE|nr:hypothetical protein AVEN_202641-1 [Araneus ventricosus]GBN38926.1 hypothetical protein AVEN_89890-1 [Araneus ventricosus]
MKGNMLPTYKDVMKFYEWNRHKVKCDNETNKEPTYKEIEDTVMEKNEEIKSRASIPIVQHEQVKAMLKTYNLKRKNLLKFCPKILKKRLVEFRQSVKHCLTLHLANENGLRLLQLPTVKFDALSYTDLIDWHENITDPSILKFIPDEDILLFVIQKAYGDLSLLYLPCHTQKWLKGQLRQ